MADLQLTVTTEGSGHVTIGQDELELLAVILARKMDLDPASFEERVRQICKTICSRGDSNAVAR